MKRISVPACIVAMAICMFPEGAWSDPLQKKAERPASGKPTTKDASALFREAFSDAQAGLLDPARAKFQQGLALAPQDTTAHYMLGMVCARQGDVPCTRTSLVRALSLGQLDKEAAVRARSELKAIPPLDGAAIFVADGISYSDWSKAAEERIAKAAALEVLTENDAIRLRHGEIEGMAKVDAEALRRLFQARDIIAPMPSESLVAAIGILGAAALSTPEQMRLYAMAAHAQGHFADAVVAYDRFLGTMDAGMPLTVLAQRHRALAEKGVRLTRQGTGILGTWAPARNFCGIADVEISQDGEEARVVMTTRFQTRTIYVGRNEGDGIVTTKMEVKMINNDGAAIEKNRKDLEKQSKDLRYSGDGDYIYFSGKPDSHWVRCALDGV